MNNAVKNALVAVGWLVGALAACWGIVILVSFLFPNLHKLNWG